MNVEQSTLPNGITILTAPMPYLHSVTVMYYVRVGSRYERATEAGISHFIEHMLFKGTRRYPTARSVSEAVENLGGDFNGGTGKETTDYSIKISSDHRERAFDVLTDLIRAPLFAPEEIEKERRVIQEELNMYKDSPSDWVHVLLDEILYPDTGLGREVVGTPASLRAITRGQMLDYLRAHYVPANLVVSVAGDVAHADVVRDLTARLGDLPVGEPPAWRPVVTPEQGPYLNITQRPTEQVSLLLAVPALRHDDPDHDTLALLNGMLGEGMSSRLFQTIREEQGLAYDIGSSTTSYYETGFMEIYIGCDPERVDAALYAVLAELRRLTQAPPSAAELQRLKDYTHGRFVIGLEDTYSVAGWLGSQMTLLGKTRTVEEILAGIDAVTPEGVQALAQRLFRTEALRLAAIGPLPPADHFIPMLKI
ncbi:MAG: insulinase family protein [Ktedonobacterales bacterium]|nr:insulinase family protein [Ktedonobacterales bacterium]